MSITELLKFLTVPDPELRQFTSVAKRMVLHWKQRLDNADMEQLLLDEALDEDTPQASETPTEDQKDVVQGLIQSVKLAFGPNADSNELFRAVLETMGDLDVVVPRLD